METKDYFDGRSAPAVILEVIAAEFDRSHAELTKLNEANAARYKKQLHAGRQLRLALVVKLRSAGVIPDYLGEYVTEGMTDADLIAIGSSQGWPHPVDFLIRIEVPGLAPFGFDAKRHGFDNKDCWVLPSVQAWFDEDGELREPVFSFESNSPRRVATVAAALSEAADLIEEAKTSIEIAAGQRREEKERMKVAAIAADLSAQARSDEIDRILALLKSDPVALALWSAYAATVAERGELQDRLAQAYDEMGLSEERWSTKAASLRRMADEADRRAEDERRRASELETDLDESKRKLRQAGS